MIMIEYAAYSEKFLEDFVKFWNESFAGERNFIPVTDEIFRKRVINKRTALERFDPNGFIIAIENGKIAGFVHAGINSEDFCYACFENWRGGTQGYIAIIYVKPQFRRKGAGSTLMQKAKAYLKDTSQIAIDGQCLNPFYGNSEGPFSPFWGTTEGISIRWIDVETRAFLSKNGFSPRYKGVSMEIDLGKFDRDSAATASEALAKNGFLVKTMKRFYPILGQKLDRNISYPENYDYDCVFCVKNDIAAGIITVYPMKELGSHKYAIFELIVQDEYRNLGIGRALVLSALADIATKNGKTCETLTLPGLSHAGFELYRDIGFQPVCEWAIY